MLWYMSLSDQTLSLTWLQHLQLSDNFTHFSGQKKSWYLFDFKVKVSLYVAAEKITFGKLDMCSLLLSWLKVLCCFDSSISFSKSSNNFTKPLCLKIICSYFLFLANKYTSYFAVSHLPYKFLQKLFGKKS